MHIGLSLGLTAPRGPSLGPNLWTFGSEFDNAAWTKTRATITANADGTADKLVEDTTASNTHLLARADAGADNAPHTFTGHFKAAGRTLCSVFLYDADAMANWFQCDLNLTSGAATIGSTGGGGLSGGTPTAVLQGDGYYLLTFRATANAGGSGGLINCQLRLKNASNQQSYTGDGASGVLIRDFALRRG